MEHPTGGDSDDVGRAKWKILASAVVVGGVDTGLEAALQQAGISRLVAALSKPPDTRDAADVKAAKHFLSSRGARWSFLEGKSQQLLDVIAKRATIREVDAESIIFEANDKATAMYLVVSGSVALYMLPKDFDELDGPPPDWMGVREQLVDVQDAFNVVRDKLLLQSRVAGNAKDKEKAKTPALAKAKEREREKERERDADRRAPIKKMDITTLPVGDGDEDDDGEASVSRAAASWGRAFGNVRLALTLRRATEEMLTKRKVVVPGELRKIKHMTVGDAFGDLELLRKPAVRRTVAVAKRKTMLIELSQFDFLWCHEHNLMISPSAEDIELLQSVSWMADVAPQVVQRVAGFARQMTFPAGQLIVREGEVSPLMYVVKEGEVSVLFRSSSKESFSLGLIGRGECFGEKPLLTGLPNDFAFVSSSRCSLLVIGQRMFGHIAKKVSGRMLEEMKSRMRHRVERLKQLCEKRGRVLPTLPRSLLPLPGSAASTKPDAAPTAVAHSKHLSPTFTSDELTVILSPTHKRAPKSSTVFMLPGDVASPPSSAPAPVPETSPLPSSADTSGSWAVLSQRPGALPSSAHGHRPTTPVGPAGSGDGGGDRLPDIATPPPVAMLASASAPELRVQSPSAVMLAQASAAAPGISRSPARPAAGASVAGADVAAASTRHAMHAALSSQVQPYEQFVSPTSTAMTGSFPSSMPRHLSAANTRLALPEFNDSVWTHNSTVTFVGGEVGAGRSPTRSPARSPSSSVVWSRSHASPSSAKRTVEERGSATSPTRSSPTKEGGTRRLAGELLQGDVLVATKQLLGSVRKMGDVHSRIYGDRGDPLQREKILAQPLKRKGLVAMGVHL